ncbi:hypothetical protein B0H10DRAFT_1942907 [Mycena sp. CBHHK59/15]|nr:hypothetical protein B0H10DRAFT_1942907 [Mycena sp. CBHHK59/15]
MSRRIKRWPTRPEQEFSQFIDDDSESDADSDAVNALVKKAKRKSRSNSPTRGPSSGAQTAIAWFHSPPSTQLGVYKALFKSGVHDSDYLSELKAMQQRGRGRTWALFMVAGGHFAGAIIRVSRDDAEEEQDEGHSQKKKKPKKPRPDTEILKHKTFHRYTTRRKQGGSQGLNDNAKGNAKSAGAQLRRYGEQALRDNLDPSQWDEQKDFLDYEGSVINKGDGRLRTFPFPTRRPTQSELTRCLMELTRAKVSHLTEDALRAQDEAYLASLPKPKPIPVAAAPVAEKPKPVKLSKEKKFSERNGLVFSKWLAKAVLTLSKWAGERRVTLLQLAAQAGHEEVTSWLLDTLHADPTVDVPLPRLGELDDVDGNDTDASDLPKPLKGSRRTAYDLARTRAVRDVFRRCAATHPDWWDWFGAARVPSALSKEMEEERTRKEGQEKGLKDRVKEREAKVKERSRLHLRLHPNPLFKNSIYQDLGNSAVHLVPLRA